MPAQSAPGPLRIESRNLKTAALFFRALKHPFRQRILQRLHKHNRLTVTELYVKLRRKQCVVSLHLSILRQAGLVHTQRAGKNIIYAVNYEQLERLQGVAKGLLKNG